MIHLRNGSRVRLRESSRIGTVVEIASGNAADAVLVDWDEDQLDSHWNRQRRTWEPSPHLEGI